MFDGIGLQMKTHNKWLKTIGISLLVATIGAAGFTIHDDTRRGALR